MKKLLNKVLSLPSYIYVVFSITLIVIIAGYMSGEISLINAGVISLIATLSVLHYASGSWLLKFITYTFFFTYVNSMTSVVIALVTNGNLIQPFMMGYIIYFGFSYLTYGSNKPLELSRNLRSRWLWSSIVATIYTLTKMILIVRLYMNYKQSELISIAIVLILSVLWVIWIHYSSKTKVNEVNILSIDETDNKIKVKIDSNIELSKTDKGKKIYKWTHSKQDAYPWLFSYAYYADNKGKQLTIITNGKVKVNDIDVSIPSNKRELLINIKGTK